MRTYHRSYGCSAHIIDQKDGTARLVVRNSMGKKLGVRHTKTDKQHFQHGIDLVRKEVDI